VRIDGELMEIWPNEVCDSNVWCESCLEAWKWRDNEAEIERGSKVRCMKCKRKDTVVGKKISKDEKGRILCPEYRIGKKNHDGIGK